MEIQGKLSAASGLLPVLCARPKIYSVPLSPMHSTQAMSERNEEPLPLLHCKWCSPGTYEASRISAVVNLQGCDSANSVNEGEAGLTLLSMLRGTSRGSGSGDSENGDTVPESNADTVTRAPSPADSTTDLVSPLTSRLKPLWRGQKAYIEGARNDSGSARRAFSTPSAARLETHKCQHCLSCGQVTHTRTLLTVTLFQRLLFGYASSKATCDDAAMSGRPTLCSPCFEHSHRLTACIPPPPRAPPTRTQSS